MLSLLFPSLDPVAFSLGPVVVRWYGLAYFFGILGAWQYCLLTMRRFPPFRKSDIDDFLIWALIGVVLGGRLGYVLFYRPDFYGQHPLDILQTWKGGMAFHGGLIGVILASWLYCRRRKLAYLSFTDWICGGVPIGLFFGRVANFINQELYGRVTTAPWSITFPAGGDVPRHPSQLYEAFLEGIVLFILLRIGLSSKRIVKKPGVLTGIFLSGYGFSRILVECFREPDAFLGFYRGGLTMGQILSLPLVFTGLFFIYCGLYRPFSR